MKVEAKEIRSAEDIFFEALSSFAYLLTQFKEPQDCRPAAAIPRKLSYQILGRENPDQRLAV
jgi:hypothetical protein